MGVEGCYSACMHSVGVRAALLYGHFALTRAGRTFES